MFQKFAVSLQRKNQGRQSNAKKSTLYYMRSLTYLQYPSETTL